MLSWDTGRPLPVLRGLLLSSQGPVGSSWGPCPTLITAHSVSDVPVGLGLRAHPCKRLPVGPGHLQPLPTDSRLAGLCGRARGRPPLEGFQPEVPPLAVRILGLRVSK